MIPILYSPVVDITWDDPGGTVEDPVRVPYKWEKHLLGYLPDAISCTHTEVRNGSYELMMTYPDNGINADRIVVDCILQVSSPDETLTEAELPMFRIYKVVRNLTGVLTVYARHISEMLSYMIAPRLLKDDWYNGIRSIGHLIFYIRRAIYGTYWRRPIDIPFNIGGVGDGEKEVTFTMSTPASIRAYMGGGELPAPDRSALEIWGGEWEYRGWSIILQGSRGSDKGYEIRYAHNISGITIDEDVDGIYTMVQGYFSNGETIVIGGRESTAYRYMFPYDRMLSLDVTSDFFDTVPTTADIQASVRSYINRNNIGNPVRMVDVDIVQLEKSSEFKDFEGVADLLLCDTVTLIYNRNGVEINAKMKVTELTYDVLQDRTTHVKLGTIQRTMVSDMVKNTNWRINQRL